MDEQKAVTPNEQKTAQPAPQIQVRSNLQAGASLESCMQDLAYWQGNYYSKCGAYAYPTPY
jgi:hypothetical protein